MPTSILNNAHVKIEVIRRAVLECGVKLHELRVQLEECAYERASLMTQEAISYYERKHLELIEDLEQLQSELELVEPPLTQAEAIIIEAIDECDAHGMLELSCVAAQRIWAAFETVAGPAYSARAALFRHYGLTIGPVTLRLTLDAVGRGVLHLVLPAPRIEVMTLVGPAQIQADVLGGWCVSLPDVGEAQHFNKFSGVLLAIEGLGLVHEGTAPEPPRAVG